MIQKQNLIKPFVFFTLLVFIIVFITYTYIVKKEEFLLQSKYTNYSNYLNTLIKNLIDDKENATLIMAISLSKDKNIPKYINNPSLLHENYENISKELKNHTKFKNVWIQLIDLNGNSIYRTWTDKKDDNLNFRKDIQSTLNSKNPSTSISVGKFDLTIKGRAPVYENKKIIAFIEVITHFNSILEKLEEQNISSLVIANKKYKSKILFPYSNTFIGDYYISNKRTLSNKFEEITENQISKYIHINNYLIENRYFIHKFNLSNNFDKDLGYILSYKNLDEIDIQAIKSFKTQIIMIVLILLIVLTSIFLFYIYNIKSKNIENSNLKLKKHIKQLKILKDYKQSILDSQSNIIVITNGKTIISANKKLLNFFTDVKDLLSFKKKYICICSAFVKMDNDSYIIDKDYDGNNWAEYILSNPKNNFKVAMYNDKKELRHFSIKLSTIKINQNIIVTLSDITNEILQIKINKERDNLLFQHSKNAAIMDILKNIAHHWRQPLSVISTLASGMKIQKELDILNDTIFIESCDNITKNTKKLSNTIDSFTSFFNTENNITNISIIDSIKETINFFDSIFEKDYIKCIFEYDKDFILNCNKSDFSQSILNIIDNSVYALVNNVEKENRIILIEFKNNILQIRDSANGIDEKIISKIFEPYFTTKHQAFGVGLGLYMVEDFFVKKLKYKINMKNVTFVYKDKKYKGTNFIINFN
uniref:cache domain-containing protein n=1 Tax=Aliarcobacter sp. TaxID=2321116 RepID=UPI0040483A07